MFVSRALDSFYKWMKRPEYYLKKRWVLKAAHMGFWKRGKEILQPNTFFFFPFTYEWIVIMYHDILRVKNTGNGISPV